MNFQFCHEKRFLLEKKYVHEQKSTLLHLKTTIFAHSQNRMDCWILEHFQQIEFFSLCLNITFKVFQIQNEKKSDIMKFVLCFILILLSLSILDIGTALSHCVYHLDEFAIKRERVLGDYFQRKWEIFIIWRFSAFSDLFTSLSAWSSSEDFNETNENCCFHA